VSRREAAASAALVFAIALLVRWFAASLVVYPVPEDTAYYVDVARNLLAGRGLITDSLWSFQTPPLVVPREAFEVWLPLPTFAATVPMLILGSTFAAAQVSSVLIGSLVPVLAWRLAADVAAERGLPPGRARTLAVGTGITAAVSLPLILHSTLPDSTMPFAALTLAACLLMNRIRLAVAAGAPVAGTGASSTGAGVPAVGAPGSTPRWPTGLLVLLGVTLGVAALTRNEAAWLALGWALLAWWLPVPRRDRIALIAVPGVIALAVFAPWMIRDWLAFGSPLPGQAFTNALSINGTDIFAWSDPPTLGRYLDVGAGRLVEMRITGIGHNLVDVLLVPGAPLSVIGLVALPWMVRTRALQPLVVVSAAIFLVTSLVFPVATTWGTFLHAAGAVHVLLIISALLALDRLIVAVGRRRGWTRPVAWLAPALTVSGALLFSAVILPSFGRASGSALRTFTALPFRMADAGLPLKGNGPVITDAPIWVPYGGGGTAIALPHEPPASVLDLAHRFGATTVVVLDSKHPFIAAIGAGGGAADCFRSVTLPDSLLLSAEDDDQARAYRVVCP
jgi:hypothetical protein